MSVTSSEIEKVARSAAVPVRDFGRRLLSDLQRGHPRPRARAAAEATHS